MPNKPLTYRAAGVDLDAKAAAFERVKEIVKTASRPETLGKLGSFGGMFALGPYEEPILVSSIDGVGTKLKIAVAMDKHDSVGYDIVAHCANDIAAQGAEPLFFLDYIGMGRLKPDTVESLIEGIARGCREAGCALIGGETAEMPDLYADGDYDLAGCMVGVVERSQAVTGEAVRPGNAIIGLPSAGLHTNGFSLARKALLEAAEMALDDPLPELNMSVGEALLVSHRSYARSCLALHRKAGVLGFAHITGGGLIDNLPRILPEGCRAVLRRDAWEVPPIFGCIQRAGNVEDAEMFRVFNMGVGMAAVLEAEKLPAAMDLLEAAGEQPRLIGQIQAGERGVDIV